MSPIWGSRHSASRALALLDSHKHWAGDAQACGQHGGCPRGYFVAGKELVLASHHAGRGLIRQR